jgi:methionyl-tRNA formyltransferase
VGWATGVKSSKDFLFASLGQVSQTVVHHRRLMIALAGEEAAGVQVLRLLAHRKHEIAAVFTDSSEDDSSASVASTAKSLGVPVHAAPEVRQPALADWLRELGVDLLLSVHSRHLIHADALEVPALGAYNLHPGLLPEYAGVNIPSWALYEGATRHGVTLHHMTAVFDEGPIVFTDAFDLDERDTGLSVLMQCVRRGVQLVGQLLELIEHGEPVPALAQDLARRRWYGAGPPDDGRLDWSRSARGVVNFVRACDYTPFPSPWGLPRCTVRGLDIGVPHASVDQSLLPATPGTVANARDGAVLIGAADAWVRLDQVEVDGRRLPATEVLSAGEQMALIDRDPHTQAVL